MIPAARPAAPAAARRLRLRRTSPCSTPASRFAPRHPRAPGGHSPNARPREPVRVIPNSLTQDEIGPITRTVTDAALLLDVMAGYDPADPITAFGNGHIPTSYTR